MILIMFSGGIDSTALLIKRLQDGDKVLACHVIIKNKMNRWKQELTACRNIVEELQRDYDFEYIERTVEREGRYPLVDSHSVAFEASQIVRNRGSIITEVNFGWNFEDDVQSEEKHLGFKYGIPEAVFKAALLNIKLPKFEMPFWDVPKIELMKYLDNIESKTFSCRNPQGPQGDQPCGNCEPCRFLAITQHHHHP